MKLATKIDRSNSRRQPSHYPHRAAIFERLEASKRYGLVSDYLVSFSGSAGRYDARVTVWRRQDTPSDIVQHYIARLLSGLVTDRRIVIAD